MEQPPGPPPPPSTGPPAPGPVPSGLLGDTGAYGVPTEQPGAIAFTIQGSPMTSNLITPTVTLNGYALPVRYGSNHFPVPAGRYHLEVFTQWVRQYGQASLDVEVGPGQVVPVFYAAPLHQFTTGSIGHEKQGRKGLGFVVVLTLVTVALVALLVVVVATL